MAFSRKKSQHKRSISYSGSILSSFSHNGSDTKLDDMMQGRPRTATTTSSAGDIESTTTQPPSLKPSPTHMKSSGSSNQLKNLFKYGSLTVDTLNPPPLVTRKSAMVTIEPISPLPDTKSSDFNFDISNQTTQQIADTLHVIERGL